MIPSAPPQLRQLQSNAQNRPQDSPPKKGFDLGGPESTVDLNDGGQWVAAGDHGVVINGRPFYPAENSRLDLGGPGSGVSVAINEGNAWLAAGEDGVILNGRYRRPHNYGDDLSGCGVGVNSSGHWIAAGEAGVMVDGTWRLVPTEPTPPPG
jgi:hypothetical protein